MKNKFVKFICTSMALMLFATSVPGSVYAVESSDQTEIIEEDSYDYEEALDEVEADQTEDIDESDEIIIDEKSSDEENYESVSSSMNEPENEAELKTLYKTYETQGSISDETDNDKLLMDYFDHQVQDNSNYSMTYASDRNSNLFAEGSVQMLLYNAIKERAKQISLGNETSSKISIDFSSYFDDLDTDKSGNLSGNELVGHPIYAASFDPDAIFDEWFYNEIESSMESVFLAAKYDCPYEFYWAGVQYSASIKNINYYNSAQPNGEMYLILETIDLNFDIKVNSSYRDNNDYLVDSTYTTLVNIAANNAKTLVDVASANCNSDKEIIEYYFDQICRFTDYDDAAVEYIQPDQYGDPWQIINVFDGMADTKVVCEGYAKAFNYLCELTTFDSSKIESYLVSGTLTNGVNTPGNHMWNIVKMDDGKNYLVDVTQGDANSREMKYCLAPAASGSVSSGYNISIGANTMTYKYHSKMSMLYTTADLTLSTSAYAGGAVEPPVPQEEGPVLTDVSFFTNSVTAPNRVKITFGASDSKANISKIIAEFKNGTKSVFVEAVPNATNFTGKVISWEGYFEADQYINEGDWLLNNILIINASREASYYKEAPNNSNIGSTEFDTCTNKIMPSCGVGKKITVTNPSYDIQPPVLTGLTVQNSTIDSPNSTVVTFTATDNAAGVKDIEAVFKNGDSTITVHAQPNAVNLAGNSISWTATFNTSTYTKAGDYVLNSVIIGDNARNGAYYKNAPNNEIVSTTYYGQLTNVNMPSAFANKTIHVNNTNEDYTAPVINDFIIDDNQLGLTERSLLTFKATDNLSGVNKLIAVFKNGDDLISVSVIPGGINTVGNDITWKSYFETSSSTKTGDWNLQGIYTQDVANNAAYYTDEAEIPSSILSLEYSSIAKISLPAALNGLKISVGSGQVEPVIPPGEESETFTVYFDAQGGALPGVTSLTVTNGNPYGTLPVPTRSGYTFLGWFTTVNGLEEINSTSVVNLTDNQTLYARWRGSSVTVTFDTNGGTLTGYSKLVYTGDVYGALPIPKKMGYSFQGWYTAQNNGYKVTSSSIVNSSVNHSLFARWSMATVCIDFDANGGIVSPDSKTVNINSKYGELPVPTKTGMRFLGWYTASEGGTLVSENTVADYKTPNVTVYAHWTPQAYTIYFDSRGGSFCTQTSRYYGAVYGTLPTTTKTGYTFSGWYTQETGGRKILSSSIFNTANNQTLYARWTANSYTLSFNANGGSVSTPSKSVKFDDLYGDLPVPTRPGYDFAGWYTDSVNGTLVTEENYVRIADNFELFAHWTPALYTLYFDSNAGSEVPAKNVAYLDTYGELPTPVMAGGRFLGWYTAIEGGTKVDADTVLDTPSDRTLYAKWDLKYTVANPVFSVPSGTELLEGDTVSITSKTNGAKIYYSIGDGIPVETEANLYVEPIKITSDVTISAVAVKPGEIKSNVIVANYTVKDESLDWGDVYAEDKADYVTENVGKTNLWVRGVKDYDYTGKPITQTDLRVYMGKTLLTPNTDYSVTYANNTKEGTASLTITGKGNYSGTLTKSFTIRALDFSLATADDILLASTNKLQKGTTVVKYPLNGSLVNLKANTDFNYVYDDVSPNAYIAPGTYPVKLVGKGHYTGTIIINEKITDKILMSKVTVKSIPAQQYTSRAIVPVVQASYGKVPLVQGTDFTVNYEDNISAGTATITLTGVESRGYVGTKKVTFKINGTSIKSVTYGSELTRSYPYSGIDITPVKADSLTYRMVSLRGISKAEYDLLASGKDAYDYTYEYIGDTKNIGKVGIKFTGINSYTDSITKYYQITGSDISKATVDILDGYNPKLGFEYTGSYITPNIKVYKKATKTSSEEVYSASDYTVTYSNNIAVGKTATILIEGKNHCCGKIKKTFIISSKTINPSDVDSIPAQYYQKGGTKPTPVIKHNIGGVDYTLVLGKDYTVSYSNNTKVNTPEMKVPVATIKGIGNYKGTVSKEFNIVQSSMDNAKMVVDDVVYQNKANIYKSPVSIFDSNGTKLAAKTDYSANILYIYGKDVIVSQAVSKNTYRDVSRIEGDTVDPKDIIPAGAEIIAKTSGTGNYPGEISGTFRFVSGSVSKASVTVPSMQYTGNPVKPDKNDIIVKVGNTILPKTEYEIIGYANNINKGSKATLTIRGMNNYGGEKTVTFSITPKFINYTVVYDKNSVSATGNMAASTFSKSGKLKSNAYVWKGHNFLGWSYTKGGSVDIKNAGVFNVNEVSVNGNTVVLYAVWD